MIYNFSCKNFRNVNVNNLTFGRINILVGPNESGKSNFIKAVTFYSSALKYAGEGGLESAFLNAVKRGGWDHLRNKNVSEDTPIELNWKMDLDNDQVNYYLSFLTGKKSEDCIIKEERMDAADKRGHEKPFNFFTCHKENPGSGFVSTATKPGETNRRIDFPLSSKEIFCKQYKDVFLSNQKLYQTKQKERVIRILEEIERRFLSIRSYSSASINTTLMREAADANVSADYLLPNASNFSAVFNQYKNDALQWRRLFVKKMQEMDPKITDLDVLYNNDKFTFYIEKKDGNTYDLSDLSEGALKALIYNLLLNLPPKRENFLLAMDEPETNLHPSWQKVLGQWVQSSESFEQCFISTHSPDFLDTFTEGFKHNEVLLFVFDGEGNVHQKTFGEIKDALSDWELGDLYRTDDPAIGGWPW